MKTCSARELVCLFRRCFLNLRSQNWSFGALRANAVAVLRRCRRRMTRKPGVQERVNQIGTLLVRRAMLRMLRRRRWRNLFRLWRAPAALLASASA
jgi:hypothetical protein